MNQPALDFTDDYRPTIHVTNWSSKRLHGPGRIFTIMARPRSWEHGEGRVVVLTPTTDLLVMAQQGQISFEEYRRRFTKRVHTLSDDRENLRLLRPGHLSAIDSRGVFAEKVVDGDTLCCACSRETAARGECHRVWAAELLSEAGWRVILDGEELPNG